MGNSDGKVRIIIDTNAETAAKQLNDVGDAFKKNASTIQKSSIVYGGYEKAVRDNIEVLRELALGGNQNTEGFQKLATQTKEYKKALEEANQAVNKATGSMQQQSSPVDALSSKLKGLVGAYLSIRGIQAVVNFTMQATEAFREQERAVLSLNNTLANAGVYSESYSKHIQELASAIQSYSNYGDEAIIKAQALGQSFIGQTRITDALTKATVDFAATTGMDLEQAFTLVGKSIGSPTNALARYGVQLNKNMTDQQKMTSITVQLGNRYEGQARQMANSSIQLKNAIGDLAESFGKALDPAVEASQKKLISGVNALSQWISKVRVLNTEIKNLTDEQELRTRYFENVKRINEAIDRQNSFTQIGNKSIWETRERVFKAQNEQILKQIELIKKQKAEESKVNKTPIKMSDEIPGLNSTTSTKTSGASQAKQIKDSYDLVTEAVEKARRAVYNTALQFGTSSPEVAKAFEQYKIANEKVQGLQDIFKVETTKTKFQQLQQEIQNTTAKLQELYLGGQGNTDAFQTTKNHLTELQTQLTDMNTAITSSVGVNWENITNSIKSNLSSALLTPLQQGESAFDRLGKIGLNVVQMIGQEIISNMLKQITLQSTLKALGSVFSFFGGGSGATMAMATVAKNGKVFNKGKVVPFARGGVVNKPTVFPMAKGAGLMGEAGPEAIMPLTRKNGRLGVEASGNGTVVNIYNQTGANIDTVDNADGSMDIFIRKFNNAMNNERTSGAFRNAYQRESSKGIQAC